MSEWLQILLSLLGLLGGSGAVVSYLLYSKQMKRIKTAEASEKELMNVKSGMVVMREQITFQAGQIEALQRMVVERETRNETLSKEKQVLEVKHSKNKGAINKAYECTFCPDSAKCPVLMQRAKNEQEYLELLCKQENKCK